MRWLCNKTPEGQVLGTKRDKCFRLSSCTVPVSHFSNAVDQTFGCSRRKNLRGKASNFAIQNEVLPLSLLLCYELVFLQSSTENQDVLSGSTTELGYIKLHLS